MKVKSVIVILAMLLTGGEALVAAGETNLLAGVRRINFVGDSLTDGAAWPDWVIETLQANGHPNLIKFDAGVAGDNAPQLKNRFAHDVLDLNPDLVILNIGTNDQEPVGEYRRVVEEMVQQVQQRGAKLLLLLPAGICDPRAPERDAQVVAYTEVLRWLANQYHCPLVDLRAAFAGGTAATSYAEQAAVSATDLAPAEAARTSRILWGLGGTHPTRNGWRLMARCVLDALDCHAPLIEKTVLESNAVTDWSIGPSIAWTATASPIPHYWTESYSGPTISWTNPPPASSLTAKAAYVFPPAGRNVYPTPPTIPNGFDPLKAGWRKFDRNAEIAKTSWWQQCWLERGGVMPMGQEVLKERRGAKSSDAGAFALAIIMSDRDTQMRLHMGGSPPFAVWLNGDFVWDGQFLRGYHPSSDRILITLHKGENHILVFSNWVFFISLSQVE